MSERAVNPKNIVAGALFVLVGALYAIVSYHTLDIGTTDNMGPGYFPLLLSGALIFVGILVALTSTREAYMPVGRIPWRAVILISLAPLVFALTLRGLGFVPATALMTIISAFAGGQAPLLRTITTAVIVTAIAVVVFLYGFGLPAVPFGPWLGF